jgi:hypothetical protein
MLNSFQHLSKLFSRRIPKQVRDDTMEKEEVFDYLTINMNLFTQTIIQLIRKYLVQITIAVLVIVTIGKNLLPSDTMFLFHDKTQYARIIEFTYALETLHIPPVWASHFNFGIGYPIFLFYAPVAYWISSFLYLMGFGVVNAVRLSMLLALIVGGWGMFAWLARRYARPAAFVGAILFVASPWFASEMFVRGNLATVWFLAFAPWTLWALSTSRNHKVLAALIISISLMTHNVLSVVWIPILYVYGMLGFSRNRAFRMKHITLAVCMSGIFWIPALLQLGQTYASEIAKFTNFRDHFLCIEQIWTTTTWGFGGSTKGCMADGMSFMIGKIQIIFALIGLVVGPFFIKKRRVLFVEGLILVWALFLSLSDARPFWELVQPIQVIQFPWRFLSIALIFVSSLSAAAIQIFIEHVVIVTAKDRLGLNKIYKRTVSNILNIKTREFKLPPLAQTLYTSFCLILGILVLLFSLKYFYGRVVPVKEIYMQFASSEYIQSSAAYDVPEYVPKTVDYTYWQSFRTKLPTQVDIRKLQKDFSTFHPNTIYQVGAGILALASFVFIICLL